MNLLKLSIILGVGLSFRPVNRYNNSLDVARGESSKIAQKLLPKSASSEPTLKHSPSSESDRDFHLQLLGDIKLADIFDRSDKETDGKWYDKKLQADTPISQENGKYYKGTDGNWYDSRYYKGTDGKWYDKKLQAYTPKFKGRPTKAYSDFIKGETKPYSIFIKDTHGTSGSLENMLNVLNLHSDISVIYLERDPKEKSNTLSKFLNEEITIDSFFNEFTSSYEKMLASQNEEKFGMKIGQFESAFKNVFEKIKEKNKAGQLKVALIDDWTKIVEESLIKNKIMGQIHKRKYPFSVGHLKVPLNYEQHDPSFLTYI